MHAPHHDRRSGGQCRVGLAAGSPVPRRQRGAGSLSGDGAVRVLHRGHRAARPLARRCRSRRFRHRRHPPPICCRCWWSALRCATGSASTTPQWSSTAVWCSVWRLSPTCRPTGSSTSAVNLRPETTSTASSASATSRLRSAPICCSRHPTCPDLCCTSRSARTCSCRFRRVRKRHWRVRRCWPTSPAARSPSAAPKTVACWPAQRRRGAWPPTSTLPPGRANRQPTWLGTARR